MANCFDPVIQFYPDLYRGTLVLMDQPIFNERIDIDPSVIFSVKKVISSAASFVPST